MTTENTDTGAYDGSGDRTALDWTSTTPRCPVLGLADVTLVPRSGPTEADENRAAFTRKEAATRKAALDALRPKLVEACERSRSGPNDERADARADARDILASMMTLVGARDIEIDQ